MGKGDGAFELHIYEFEKGEKLEATITKPCGPSKL